jgi:adenylate cyclase
MPNKRLTLLFIALAILLAGAVDLAALHIVQTLENRVADTFQRLHAQGRQADPEVVLVDIDEKSLTALSEEVGKWPWPRALHAELIQGLLRQNPRAILFDMIFAEPDVQRRESDALFAETVAMAQKVYLPLLKLEGSGPEAGAPLAEIAPLVGAVKTPGANPAARAVLLLPSIVPPEHWQTGSINFLGDADGVARRHAMYLNVDGWLIPSLPARLAKNLGFTLPKGETFTLAWAGERFAHPRVSYSDLYADFQRQKPQRPANEFTDKIILIGSTASGLHDLKPSPLHPQHPGTEILATAIDNLKNQRFMTPVSPWAGWAFAALVMAGLMIAFQRRLNTMHIGAMLLGLTVLLYGLGYFAVTRLVLLPIITPLLLVWAFYFAAALHAYLRELRQREEAVRQFSRFVNPHVVKQLVERGGLTESGESREVTLLFSDIRGFTTLSETRKPEEVVQFLNQYFSRQVGVIFQHGGALDKFIGDAIMAIWGAPLDDPEHARHAVETALDMVDTLEAFKRDVGGELGAIFDVGIGVHSGPAVVGLIGSEQRREYTAIGDTVNLASRIEGLTKGVARVLVSEDTMMRCANAFDFVERGSYKVKGREQEVRLFEPRRKSP